MTTKSKSKKGKVHPILSKAEALDKNLKNLGLNNLPYLVAVWEGRGLKIRHNIDEFELEAQRAAWRSLSALVIKALGEEDA